MLTEIESFSEELYAQVLPLLIQLTGRPATLTREEMNRVLLDPGVRLLAVMEGEKLTGMLTLALYPSLAGGLKAWIEDVVVDSAHRGKGTGRELVSGAVALARKLGARSISLTSSPARIEANKLYPALGFARRETNHYTLKLHE